MLRPLGLAVLNVPAVARIVIYGNFAKGTDIQIATGRLCAFYFRMGDMRRFHIEFDVDVPDNITLGEFTEWARFNCHDNGQCSGDNPLVDEEIEPVRWSFEVEDRGHCEK
jgi:hypothetical protein